MNTLALIAHSKLYFQEIWENTGYQPEDLPGVMDNREDWKEIFVMVHAIDTPGDDEGLPIYKPGATQSLFS